MDNWDRKPNFNHCDSCIFFVPKREHSSKAAIQINETDAKMRIAEKGEQGIEISGPSDSEGRCRRNAPIMNGEPVVYASDWCGEYIKRYPAQIQ